MADAPKRPALMQAATIRQRCAAVSRWVEDGHSEWWAVDRGRLELAAREVSSITLERFPSLGVPFHSRWRHFEAGGVDRAKFLDERLLAARIGHGSEPALLATIGLESEPALLAKLELCVVSVLLDAGAGAAWRFVDRNGQRHQRSEGLAVASFEAFVGGVFSSSLSQPPRADAKALAALDAATLASVFQQGDDNPLAGLDGRLALLNRLGQQLLQCGVERVADLYTPLIAAARSTVASGHANRPVITAADLLEATVTGLAQVWIRASIAPDGSRGDLWPHPAARDDPSSGAAGIDIAATPDSPQGWVPFHKLSQWLCYSLIEPLCEAGFDVIGLDALTALPEYRNGGLLVDTGVIALREPQLASRTLTPGDPLVIEWRALTVTLIDALAGQIRRALGRDAQTLPLACILEGGTWATGRRLAERLRGGRPPLEVDTAGSVF